MSQQAALATGTTLAPLRVGQWIDPVDDHVNATEHDADRINIDLLGGLRVRVGGTTLGPRELGGSKPRRILLALLLHRGSPVSKDRLLSLLWGGCPPSSAKATLEAYICVLRKKLQPGQGRGSVITTVSGCYAIDMSRVNMDVVRYEGLISAALHPAVSAADALPMLRRAMAIAEAPLLPEEVDSEWLDDVRRIHNQSIRSDLIAAAHKVAGLPFDSAERWARLALEGDPLDESAWHALLKSMEASGQHADGLQAYDQCRKLFAAELGCAPGPGLQEVYARLLRGTNEDDEELSRLLDAVVRLHTASRLGSSPKVTALDNRRRGASGQSTSVEQAFHALSLLLRSVGGRRTPFAGAIGA
jgi:DNA-binding SARP family transcriptional activator